MFRVSFTNKRDLIEFFNEVRSKLNVQNWRKLGELIGTNKSMIDNYKSGKLCIPEERFNKMLRILGENRKKYFLQAIEKKNKNWGQIIGGKMAYNLNKKYFDEGRKIAAKSNKDRVKNDFDINMPLSPELCEFIGVFIGDGFTNKYRRVYHTEITGDRNLDSNYYYSVLKPICQRLFNVVPHIKEREGYIRLILYSKRLFEMLIQRFKMPAGVKCYSVIIPNEIFKADEILLRSTLIGMFNTDGGIGFDKRKKYKIPYIRINYTSVSEKLIQQLSEILLRYNIPHSIHKKSNSFMIQINGIENTKKFISKIGFSNKRHMDKIRHLI